MSAEDEHEMEDAGLNSPLRQLISDQQAANQHLLVCALRAQEQSELATAALARAERSLARLRESEQALRAAAELRERALGMVGHDLRNPLSAISMCVHFLRRQDNLSEESCRMLDLAIKSLRRMDRMIGLLFDFTRVRLGGDLPIERAPAELGSICHDAIQEIELGRSIAIRRELSGDTRGTWDAARLVEALSNLIGNALDHAAPGTDVLVRAYGDDRDVVIEVTNRGEPIPLALLPVLFAAFHQGWSGFRAKTGHLGLGLYIAHEIIRAHGGAISVRCAGGTTTFTTRLPRSPGPD